ncbi:NtaA/DmoA family FMN-dependent monooxygenase [Streptomyces sp. NPDC048275]|uniref:NtaA/DmoA family FMN-dependent monooxygenase n=1 Tax=Streptomyces sp. NPDC048275 TaxID=3155629 RepID=UPI0033F8272E
MRKELVLNGFHMNAVTHMYDGGWRNPDDRQIEFSQLEFWQDVARTLERGFFDNIFFADAMGSDPAYNNDWSIYPRQGIHFPCHDPLAVAAALIATTEHIGLTFTSGVVQDPPFNFAKRISTLDHLSRGRIGWNIVTGHIENGFRNLGFDGMLPHDERYARAEEYMEVVYKLWEGSWEDDAVIADKAAGVYADAERIHKINHAGEYYRVEGPHIVTPSPQRTPVLFQAGSSTAGRAFAARHAEGAFVLCLHPAAMRTASAKMKPLLEAEGRSLDDLVMVQGMSFVVGSTEEEAKRKAAELDQYLDTEVLKARVSRDLGIDLGGVQADQPLDTIKTDYVQGIITLLQEAVPDGRPKVRDLPMLYSVRVVGTPEQIADELQVWQDAGMGGINVAAQAVPGTIAEFVDHVVPVLQKRGLAKREYAPGTLREKLFPGRPARLEGTHPGASYRRVHAN